MATGINDAIEYTDESSLIQISRNGASSFENSDSDYSSSESDLGSIFNEDSDDEQIQDPYAIQSQSTSMRKKQMQFPNRYSKFFVN